jgi:hypothetical protein
MSRPSIRIGIALIAIAQLSHGTAAADTGGFPGASGMALFEGSTFIIVNDTPAGDQGERVGVYEVGDGTHMRYTPLAVAWPHGESNQLEAICPVAERPGEFLAAERDPLLHPDGSVAHPARVFHLRITNDSSWKCEVLGSFDIPEDVHGVEGIATYMQDADRSTRAGDFYSFDDVEYSGAELQASISGGDTAATSPQTEVYPAPPSPERVLRVILGEAGGDVPYAAASADYADLDLSTYKLGSVSKRDLAYSSYNCISTGSPWMRYCTDLYIDAKNQLWVSATIAAGTTGPYRSVIYFAGEVVSDPYFPGHNYGSMTWSVDGLKVEAISKACLPNSVLSVASDDDAFGGVWRPLPPAGGN